MGSVARFEDFHRAAGTRTGLPGREPDTAHLWGPERWQSKTRFAIDTAGNVYLTSGASGLYAFAVGATTWTLVSGTNGLPYEAVGALATDAAGAVYAAIDLRVYKLVNEARVDLRKRPSPSLHNRDQSAIDDAGNAWATIERVRFTSSPPAAARGHSRCRVIRSRG
jgi:hypothetical protein